MNGLSVSRCRVCGTRWLFWHGRINGLEPGIWNLLDQHQRPGSCCHNAPMGDQIEFLRDIIAHSEEPVPAAAREGAEPVDTGNVGRTPEWQENAFAGRREGAEGPPAGYLVTFDGERGPEWGIRRVEFYLSKNDAEFNCRKLSERNSTIEPLYRAPRAMPAGAEPERPQGTCATCRFWNRATVEMDDSDDPTYSGWHRCDSPQFPSGGTYTPPSFACNLHEPVTVQVYEPVAHAQTPETGEKP